MLCRCPTLSPLQARLVAAVSTLLVMCLIYWTLVSPPSAYASELALDGVGNIRDAEDHNWHRIRESELDEEEYDSERDETVDDVHQSEDVVEDQEAASDQAVVLLGNNVATPQNVGQGDSTIWRYPATLLAEGPVGLGVGLPSALDERLEPSSNHPDLRKRDGATDDELRPRQNTASGQIFISATTCQQPIWNGTDTQTVAPPQLTLWVAETSDSASVGPQFDINVQNFYPFVNGFVNATVNATGDWYMAVSAPSGLENFTGEWNYQIAVSLDDYFHAANQSDPFLFQVDTDSTSALLVTANLTTSPPNSTIYQQWMDLSAPFVLFASNVNITQTMGVESSFCGLQNVASQNRQIQASQSDPEGKASHVELSMITRGPLNYPKEQFYVTDLNRSSSYMAYLALDGNSTASGNGVVGGGGKVWTGVPFNTKSDGNCQLLFNLDFCDNVAYAVPSNPNNLTVATNLSSIYDNYTSNWYANFNYTLMQVACATTADAQYSLARTCSDCQTAYKDWLCAVTIPRCEDYTNPAAYLQPRAMGYPFWNNGSMLPADVLNTPYVPMRRAPTVQGTLAFSQTYNSSFATNRSRNPMIDTVISPGPYNEVLPCEDLCYDIMRSCPAALNLVCPYRGRGLEVGYGFRNASAPLQCNYPGAVYQVNAAGAVRPPGWWLGWGLLTLLTWCMVR